MGKFAVGALEQAPTVLSFSFTATGNSGPGVPFIGNFNFEVQGTFVGTVGLYASIDGGANYVPFLTAGLAPVSLTAPGLVPLAQYEPGTLLQLQCTAFTSGTAAARVSAGATQSTERFT